MGRVNTKGKDAKKVSSKGMKTKNEKGASKKKNVREEESEEEESELDFDENDEELMALAAESGDDDESTPEIDEDEEEEGAQEQGAVFGGDWVDSEDEVPVAESEDEGDDEALGARLEKLSKANPRAFKSTSTTSVPDAASSFARGAAPTADSLVTLLDQALQSGDNSLLEHCLLCTNPDVIDATTARLPTHRVVTFLRSLVAKFEKKPSRGLLVTQWLSCLLRHHLSFLLTLPDVSAHLASLTALLKQRASGFSRLSALNGRLELALCQVQQQQYSGLSSDTSMEPLAVFEA